MKSQPPQESWISPKVEIRDSELGGKGMFAKEKISAGEKMLVWGGEYVTENEAEKAKTAGKLVMQWDTDLFSIEDRGEDDAYYLNHSCDPNVWMKDAHTLIARRDVGIGEELTADYAMWEANEDYVSKWECNCGAENCRGRVTGKDWENSGLQNAYKNHFSPLINKRIRESKLPQIIKNVGFDFSWDEKKVWELDVPTEEISIEELTWHFDVPFHWHGGEVYNLSSREVIENPEKYSDEYTRTMKSDLAYPIDIMENKGRWLILDGLHRLMKAYIQGQKTVNVRKISRNKIPEILKVD